jgi:hypothetical protein
VVARASLYVLLPVLAASLGCHSVVEYTDSGEFGAVLLDAEDLSVVGYVAGMDGARSLASMGSHRFLVGTSDGAVYEVDSQAMVVLEQHRVSAGSGAGVERMVKSPSASSLYLLTGSGRILEMDQYGFDVLDQFSACAAPSDICRSPSSIPRIYVADEEEGLIQEVWTSDNHLGKSILVPERPVALAGYCVDPDIIVSAHAESGGVNLIGLETEGYTRLIDGSEGPFADVAVAMQDTVCCAVSPDWDSQTGRLHLVATSGIGPNVEVIGVEGHPRCVCANPLPDKPFFYVACADGQRTLVLAVDYLNSSIEACVELEGYPWAISTHQSGQYLIVLTSL